jgi:predicted ribosomally synthesized peptide with nif11-like leader
MSKRAFEEFMSRAAQDERLRREVEVLASRDQGVPASALVELAARHGYSFEVEDVGHELSEEDLESVAGGVDLRGLPVRQVVQLEESTKPRGLGGDPCFRLSLLGGTFKLARQ